MLSHPVTAVLIHIPEQDHPRALEWYARVFPQATRVHIPQTNFTFLNVDGVALEIVRSDNKVASGVAGTVVYWACTDFHARLQEVLELGAVLFRGPMRVEGNMGMCQVKDPWGNAFGLRGPA